MSDYRPTFKPTPAQRPLAHRLTPLAWVLVAIAVLLVTLAAVGLLVVLPGCSRGGVWNPTPTLSPALSEVEGGVEGPTVTTILSATAEAAVISPTPEWWAGMVTPAVEPTPAHPAWWSEQMTQDENGNWWPPQEVIQMVGDHYAQRQAEQDAIFLSAAEEGRPPDLDALQAIQTSWSLGPVLDGVPASIGDLRANRIQPVVGTGWQTCVPQAQEFSADGLECTMGWLCLNGLYTVYDPLTGEALGDPYPVENGGLFLTRMRYDPTDGRWKVYEALSWISGGSQ